LLLLLLAFLTQSLLSWMLPMQAPILDPFLIVVVYCGLVGGENHGMLAGSPGQVGSWTSISEARCSALGLVQNSLVGYTWWGLASTRFLLTAPGPRALVVLLARPGRRSWFCSASSPGCSRIRTLDGVDLRELRPGAGERALRDLPVPDPGPPLAG
jgi:hypothetical protein